MTNRRKAEKMVLDAVRKEYAGGGSSLPPSIRDAFEALRATYGRKKDPKTGKPKQKTLMQLDETELWPVFARYIENRDRLPDDPDHGICRSCGDVIEIVGSHACHFISRAKIPTKYDERNVHLGCAKCNAGWKVENHQRNLEEYIARTYGESVPDELRFKSNQRSGRDRKSVEKLIWHYKQIVQRMEKER